MEFGEKKGPFPKFFFLFPASHVLFTGLCQAQYFDSNTGKSQTRSAFYTKDVQSEDKMNRLPGIYYTTESCLFPMVTKGFAEIMSKKKGGYQKFSTPSVFRQISEFIFLEPSAAGPVHISLHIPVHRGPERDSGQKIPWPNHIP